MRNRPSGEVGRYAATLLFALLVLPLACGSAFAQLTPFTGQVMVADVPSDAMPAVAMDDHGDFLVVWAGEASPGAGHLDILACRFDRMGNALTVSGGSSSRCDPIVVNRTTAGTQNDPEVAFLPGSTTGGQSGSFVVVWTGANVDESGVYANIVDGSDDVVLPSDQLVAPGGIDVPGNPSVAAYGSGFVVVWQLITVPGSEIHGRLFDSGGTATSADLPLVANGDPVGAPFVGIDDGGGFVVSWSCFNCGGVGSFEEVRAMRYSAAGMDQGSEILVNDYTSDNQRVPRVRSAGDGSFLIAWDNGKDGIPQFTQFNAVGAKANCPGTPCDRPAAEKPGLYAPMHVDPALSRDRSFVTAYETFVSGPGPRIDAMFFDRDGNAVDSTTAGGNQVAVHDSQTMGSAARNPRVATDGDRTYVFVYDDTKSFVAARVFSNRCGDPNGDGKSSASEALLALTTAVGTGACAGCFCDVNNSGNVTAPDALQILRRSVGLLVALVCPPCP